MEIDLETLGKLDPGLAISSIFLFIDGTPNIVILFIVWSLL